MTNRYKRVAEGPHCEVWVHDDVEKALRNAPAKDRARVGNIIEHLSAYGQDGLHEEKFKFEDRYTVGHERIPVYAIKSYQVRIMGGWREGKTRKFLCPEATIKKNNKASQEQLKRVAKKVGEYNDDR